MHVTHQGQRHKYCAPARGELSVYRLRGGSLLVRRYLHSRGYRYRVNVRRFPGTPDIVLRKYRTVIFINGCFWHGHEDCRYYVPPKSNSQYWQQKIERNKERDVEKRIKLRMLGWHTITIWE